MPLLSELRPFQSEGVRQIRDWNGVALLSDEVGLGKTVQALAYADRFLPDDPPGPIVVVVPSHLKINWKREALKHLGARAEILSGQRVPWDKEPPHDPNQIFVINYDVLVPPGWRSRMKLPVDSWVHWLIQLRPRMVILDEGHYVKNHQSRRTRACKKLCEGVDHVLILTGTPLPNKPHDLWSLLNILRPDEYPSRFAFCSEYTHATKYWWGWDFRGAKNLNRLHRLLRHPDRGVMIRRRKQDVLQQLPAVTHTIVPVEVDLVEYQRAESDYIAWLEESAPQLAASAAKAKKITQLTHLKHLAGELKVPAILDHARDFLAGSEKGKILIGALHYSVTDALLGEFSDREAVLVDGRINRHVKQERFDRFNLVPECRVFVGNLDAAGTGWSCTSSSEVWIGEFPWVPGALEQFVGRIHGIERGIPGTGAVVRHFVAMGTVDEDICELLRVKLGWSNSAVDGLDNAGWSDVYEEVTQRIKARVDR